MEKPENWDSTPAETGGSFDNPKAGGYVLKILDAEYGQAKNSGRNQIVITADIASGPYKGFYNELSEKINKGFFLNCYWGTDGKDTGRFKGNIESIEKSNAGFKFSFDEKTLIGKLIGANLREEEYESKGKIRTKLSIGFCCPVADVPNLKPMEPKTLSSKKPEQEQQSQSFSDGLPIPSEEYSLPF